MVRDMGSSSTEKLLLVLFLILFMFRTSKALEEHNNCSSSCGDLNVRSPFRLKDSPENCGDKRYELSCKQNQVVMYLQSGKYIVLSIDYDNYTIRVRDSSIVELDSSSTSLPIYSLSDYNFSKWDPYTSTIDARNENGVFQYYILNTNMVYVRCEHTVLYVFGHSHMFQNFKWISILYFFFIIIIEFVCLCWKWICRGCWIRG